MPILEELAGFRKVNPSQSIQRHVISSYNNVNSANNLNISVLFRTSSHHLPIHVERTVLLTTTFYIRISLEENSQTYHT